MPNRIIKESINESKKLSEVSFFAADLYKRLITYADDYGRFNADYQIVLARLYPREIGIVTEYDIEDALTELIGAGKIAFYTSEARNEVYGCFPKWDEHQNIRTVKSKFPDPTDTKVNDYYLRRFIPHEMKKKVVEKHNFKCAICHKYLCLLPMSADRFIKMGAGLYNIDHIVPVNQGGRATIENLRLTCPHCNKSRKKRFTTQEIAEFTLNPSKEFENCSDFTDCNKLQQIAADCNKMLLESNPIQSESNPNPNPNPNPREARFEEFWKKYPKKVGKGAAEKAFDKIRPTEQVFERMLSAIEKQKNSAQWKKDNGQYIPNPATWLNQQRWEDEVTSAAVSSSGYEDFDQKLFKLFMEGT